VLAAAEILLDRLVRAVGIASQDGAAALEKIVYPVADRRVRSRNGSRSADENVHTVRLVAVSVSR